MMKKNFQRLFAILCVTALLFASVGCDRADGKLSDTDGKSEAQTDDKVISQDPGTETEKPSEETDHGNADADTVSFRADLYIQKSVLSWMYSFDGEIKDGKFYIEGELCEREPLSAAPAISYGESMLFDAERLDKENESLKMSDTLKKIEESEPFCVLKTDWAGYGGIISVYKIDGAYYFVRFFDNGEIMRIHRAVIEGTAEV